MACTSTTSQHEDEACGPEDENVPAEGDTASKVSPCIA